ncbi:hypothetical protein HYDPIDRAFT_114933 [Hydnomerulius pinastri MD-312]|uniref:Unplaced genomic scaffold scaffold_23, whole genome shotgun sequence n=1 Tax=Hydnomerulius pinastri MD-312 TaxID=994086 RepID=A0A0C9W5Q9_9AGAM|nr:hypothetical protein HYDPIDRAFT_114933 [Hydnomerulius pinastri MD-312]
MDMLITPRSGNHARVVALLRPLTKCRALRESVLSPDVIEGFLQSLDKILQDKRSRAFDHAMDCLACLMEYDELSSDVIKALEVNWGSGSRSRLSWMLDISRASLHAIVLVAHKGTSAAFTRSIVVHDP